MRQYFMPMADFGRSIDIHSGVKDLRHYPLQVVGKFQRQLVKVCGLKKSFIMCTVFTIFDYSVIKYGGSRGRSEPNLSLLKLIQYL